MDRRDANNRTREEGLMKMRKLFAAVAAAATLIGGMVLSASSAQADGVAAGTTITVNNP